VSLSYVDCVDTAKRRARQTWLTEMRMRHRRERLRRGISTQPTLTIHLGRIMNEDATKDAIERTGEDRQIDTMADAHRNFGEVWTTASI